MSCQKSHDVEPGAMFQLSASTHRTGGALSIGALEKEADLLATGRRVARSSVDQKPSSKST